MKKHGQPGSNSNQARFIAFSVSGIAASALVRAADNSEVTVAKAVSTEQRDREVDQVALSAQDSGHLPPANPTQKIQNTSQEPVFLSKLADIQQPEGRHPVSPRPRAAAHSKKALDLSAHHKTTQPVDRLAGSPHFALPGLRGDLPRLFLARQEPTRRSRTRPKPAGLPVFR